MLRLLALRLAPAAAAPLRPRLFTTLRTHALTPLPSACSSLLPALSLPLLQRHAAVLVRVLRPSPALCETRRGSRAKTPSREVAPPPPSAPPLTLATLWGWLRADAWLLAGAVAAAVAVAIANVQIPAALGVLVNVVTKGAGVAALRPVALRIFGLYLAQAALTSSYIFLLSVVGERLAQRLRNQLYTSILHQDISFFDEHRSGEIVDRISGDIQEFKSSFKQIVSLGLRNATQIAGSIVAMVTISAPMAGALLLFVPLAIGVGTMLGSRLRGMSRDAQDATAAVSARAGEVVGNVRTVRAFAAEEAESAAMAVLTSRCRDLNVALGLGIGMFTGLTHLFINTTVLGVLFGGGLLMERNLLTAGDLMTFLVSTQTVERSLSNMSVLFGQVVRGANAGARVLEYMSRQPRMPLRGGRALEHVRGSVEFVDVTFAYPSRPEQTVLSHFSFKIPAGKVVALCGHSGAGKSTIAGLVERFYDPVSGAVLLDGADMQQLDPSWMRGSVMGYISQEPVLFATTVFENIRYGRPDATAEEVYAAARQANADTFIREFPHGYDTPLGERGATVSGGQRQRIAIARALLKDPKILVLDEATSALDADSERLVQQALERLSAGRTVLVIAHRLSTIKNADIIAVVEGGAVVEQGTHAELIARPGGRYAALVQHQLATAERGALRG